MDLTRELPEKHNSKVVARVFLSTGRFTALVVFEQVRSPGPDVADETIAEHVFQAWCCGACA